MALGWSAFYASLDEALSFHEGLSIPVRDALDVSGVLYFAWVIPYGIAVLILGAACLRFVLRLDRATRNLFIVAGALYVGGAVGFELIGGWLFGRRTVEHAALRGSCHGRGIA